MDGEHPKRTRTRFVLFDNLPERPATNKWIKVIEPNVSVSPIRAKVSLNSNLDLVLTDFTGIKLARQ